MTPKGTDSASSKAKFQLFCPTCSENVDLYQSKAENEFEYRCVFCGQVLERGKLNENQFNGVVLTAEDSPLLREMLKDLLLEKQLADEVSACENGQEIVTLFTRTLKTGKVPGAVILDVIMPVMNGFFTAIALRGVENAFEVKTPTPIIFLSAKALDKDFQKVINFCKPCYYVQKGGDDENADALGKKIEEIAAQIRGQ